MATIGWDSGYRKTVSIANAATISDVLNLTSLASHGKWAIAIHAPAALTGTVTVEVSDAEAGPWDALQSGGADVTLPAVKTTQITDLTARYMRFNSSLAEGAQRDFRLEASLK